MISFLIIFTLHVPALSGGPPLTLDAGRATQRFSSVAACNAHAAAVIAEAKPRVPPGRTLTHECRQVGGLT